MRGKSMNILRQLSRAAASCVRVWTRMVLFFCQFAGSKAPFRALALKVSAGAAGICLVGWIQQGSVAITTNTNTTLHIARKGNEGTKDNWLVSA